MLNPLIRWEPGTVVRYHGSLTALHGLYTAHPCDCGGCDDPRTGTVRFQLRTQDGTVAVSCVRARSITPAEGEDEPEHEECLGIHNTADGYRDCGGTPI